MWLPQCANVFGHVSTSAPTYLAISFCTCAPRYFAVYCFTCVTINQCAKVFGRVATSAPMCLAVFLLVRQTIWPVISVPVRKVRGRLLFYLCANYSICPKAFISAPKYLAVYFDQCAKYSWLCFLTSTPSIWPFIPFSFMFSYYLVIFLYV